MQERGATLTISIEHSKSQVNLNANALRMQSATIVPISTGTNGSVTVTSSSNKCDTNRDVEVNSADGSGPPNNLNFDSVAAISDPNALPDAGNDASVAVSFVSSLDRSFSIYEWAAIEGTQPRRNFCVSLMILFMSVVVIVSQICLIYSLTAESTSPTCVTHDSCPLGMACLPRNLANTPSDVGVGQCFGCSTVNAAALENIDTVVDIGIGSATSTSFLLDGQQHCLDTKTLASDECDYIHLSLAETHGTHAYVLVFAAFLLGIAVIEDLDHSWTEAKLVAFRIRELNTQRPSWQNFFMWHTHKLQFLLRVVFLPASLASGAVNLCLSAPLAPQNILLNMISLGFIAEIDNVLAVAFLPPMAEAGIVKAREQFLTRLNKEMRLRSDYLKAKHWFMTGWILRRLYVIVLINVLVPYCILTMESLTKTWSDECDVRGPTMLVFVFATSNVMLLFVLPWVFTKASNTDIIHHSDKPKPEAAGDLSSSCCMRTLVWVLNSFFGIVAMFTYWFAITWSTGSPLWRS